MKYKILFSILGIFLLLGMVVAGGIALTQRDATVTTAQRDALLSKEITDIKSTTMKCNDDYCTFWITKENVINSERMIQKYKEVCTEERIDIKPEECTKDNMRLDEKDICWETTCVQVLKDEKELLDERASITDKAISSLADSIIVDAGKGRDNPDVGTDEEVLIGAKPK
jgi:hypothetical protein